ncbi:MAG: GAF domain-containing protein, partial [Leptospiraceae bacterium]|nr:GAF domain-containing protein [Leptospiraceae bacterium]
DGLTALKQAFKENKSIKVALDNVSTNIMMADNDLKINYMNKSIVKMFTDANTDIQKQIPGFNVSTLMGTNIDKFHRNPSHQRGILASFVDTYRSTITIGGRTFDLIANPILDEKGIRLGSVVEWSDVTKSRTLENEKNRMMEENLRIRVALDNVSTNIMMADNDLNVIYMNKSIKKMFEKANREISNQIKSFDLSKLMGSNIDTYHKDPSHQRKILGSFTDVYKTSIDMGGRRFDLIANPILTDNGERLGSVVEWSDVTEILKIEEQKIEQQKNLEVMTKVSMGVNEALDISSAIQSSLDAAREVFGWEYSSFWKYDKTDKSLKFYLESGSVSSEFRNITERASFKEGVGLNGRAWKSKDLVFVKELVELTDCVRAPVASKVGVKSAISFPIFINDKIYGTMDFFALRTLELSANRLQSLKAVNRIIQESLERQVNSQEMVRVKVALDNVSTNIMISDNDRNIIYMNKSINKMFKNALTEIKNQFSNFDQDRLIGNSIDVFHKNPAHQSNLLANFKEEYRSTINIGGRTFNLIANPIITDKGERLGSVVEWADYTNEVKTQNEIDDIVNLAIEGQFNSRIKLEDKEGFFKKLGEGINKLLDVTSNGMNDIARVL